MAVGCSQVCITVASQCEAMRSVAESATTSWNNAQALETDDTGSHYCYSNPPCDEVTCLIGRSTVDRLRFILLRCNDPPAFRMITEQMITGYLYGNRIWLNGVTNRGNDFTFSKSAWVDFTLANDFARLVVNVTMEHYSNAIGLKMDTKQIVTDDAITPTSQSFVPYIRVPFDSISGCTSGPISSDVASTQSEGQDTTSESVPTAAIAIPVVSVLSMMVIATATIITVVILVRKKHVYHGARAEQLIECGEDAP